MKGRTIKWSLACGIVLILYLTLYSYAEVLVSIQDYTVTNNAVWIDDENIYLSAYPHTIHGSETVTFDLSTKSYSGDIDVVWGFDTESVKPSNAKILSPHWENETGSYTCDCTSFTSEGVVYSDCFFEYTLSPNYFWCYRNLTHPNQSIETVTLDEGGFDSGNVGLKTVYWNIPHFVLYRDFKPDQKILFDYGGMNTWYVARNLPILSGDTYTVEVGMDLIPKQGEVVSGKYWVCTKPSSWC